MQPQLAAHPILGLRQVVEEADVASSRLIDLLKRWNHENAAFHRGRDDPCDGTRRHVCCRIHTQKGPEGLQNLGPRHHAALYNHDIGKGARVGQAREEFPPGGANSQHSFFVEWA